MTVESIYRAQSISKQRQSDYEDVLDTKLFATQEILEEAVTVLLKSPLSFKFAYVLDRLIY